MQTIIDKSPSPAYFSATLPSSPIAEISIVFGIRGANKVIFSDEKLAKQILDLMLKECGEVLFVEINIPKNPTEIENSFAKAVILAS
jgi:hypothetical protein